MTSRFVCDASAVIALATTGHLDVLRRITGRLHMTATVLDECLGERPGAGAIREALDQGWIVKLPSPATDIRGLGAGEATTIAVAKPRDVLVLDDRAARLEARSRGLQVIGLLGLVLHGVAIGKITQAEGRQLLGDLSQGTFRMTAELYREALARLEASD